MEEQAGVKWYLKTSTLVIALLCIGPFALPLAWSNPRYSRLTKVAITVVVLAVTYLLVKATCLSIKSLSDYYKQIFG